MDVVANIGGLKDAQDAAVKGAEGVGLLRSEFLFMGRDSAPTEDEQAQIYIDIAREMPGKPLVIRTLDVGGDKPLSYLPIAPEENPFLGLRGVRVGLDRPDILRTQARAILRAVEAHNRANKGNPANQIRSLALPGLCTGTGKMAPERAAFQMWTAYRSIVLGDLDWSKTLEKQVAHDRKMRSK